MFAILGIAAVLIALALAGERKGAAKSVTGFLSPVKTNLPEFVKRVVVDLDATPEELRRASLLAHEHGYPQLGLALQKRSELAGASGTKIPSPWKDVSDSAWTRFATAVAEGHAVSEVNPRGFFGIFQLGVRRLCDLSVMSSPRSRNEKGADGQNIRIWEGTWLISKENFFSDAKLQYDLFAKSMELYRNVIAEKYKQVVGLEIFPGQKATLSGLLGIAHMAGSEGMHKWLTQSDIRQKFSWVTEAFKKTNGIF